MICKVHRIIIKESDKIHLLIEIPFSNDDSTSVSFKRKVSKTDPIPSKRQKIATNSETKTIYMTDISDYIEVIDGMEQVGSAVEVDTDTDIIRETIGEEIGEEIGDNIGDNFDDEIGDKIYDTIGDKDIDKSDEKEIGSKSPQFVCSICELPARSMLYLSRHVSAVHGKTLLVDKYGSYKIVTNVTNKDLVKFNRIDNISDIESIEAKKSIEIKSYEGYEESSGKNFDDKEIYGKLDNYKGVVKEWQNYLKDKLNSPSTIGTKKLSIIKCQVPPKKKTENDNKIDIEGSESNHNTESTNISPFRCKIIPKKVLDSLTVIETSAEKDQPKDVAQVNVAKVIELPKMSEDIIEIDANYFEKVTAPVLDLNNPTCNYCDQKFATLSKLQNHFTEVHKVGNDGKTEIDSVLEEINEVFDKDKSVQEGSKCQNKGKNIEKQSSSFVTIKFSRNHVLESSTKKSETSSENSSQKIADTRSQSQFDESFENDAKIVDCEIVNVSFSKHATQITKPIDIGTEKHKSVSKSQFETRKSPRKK